MVTSDTGIYLHTLNEEKSKCSILSASLSLSLLMNKKFRNDIILIIRLNFKINYKEKYMSLKSLLSQHSNIILINKKFRNDIMLIIIPIFKIIYKAKYI